MILWNTFRNYIKIGRWSDIRCFLLIWKSIWVFFLRLEGCLLSDHLPPNKPNFYLISDHLPHFQISDIRPEDYLNTLIYLISDLKSSTFANIWYQTRRLSECFKILISDRKVIHICKYFLSNLKVMRRFQYILYQTKYLISNRISK